MTGLPSADPAAFRQTSARHHGEIGSDGASAGDQALSSTHANHSRIRFARFVSTWNVCCGAAAMTPNTAAICSLVSASWKRSDIELTKMRRGLRHRSGSARCSGTMRTSPFHRTWRANLDRSSMLPSGRFVSVAATFTCRMRISPSYGMPAPENRPATRSA